MPAISSGSTIRRHGPETATDGLANLQELATQLESWPIYRIGKIPIVLEGLKGAFTFIGINDCHSISRIFHVPLCICYHPAGVEYSLLYVVLYSSTWVLVPDLFLTWPVTQIHGRLSKRMLYYQSKVLKIGDDLYFANSHVTIRSRARAKAGAKLGNLARH
ncbi:hypothetical protein DL98DRAFT_577876 [Cadophora sp. DSE1049]|nr:hypothetical protein DL98DRAFT_577876 [Cadophora sp. DSE1049]